MSGVKGSLISTSASSSSRLSPLAPPFTIKTSSRHENVSPSLDFSSQGFASGVDHPFSQLSLDAYLNHAYHSDATAIAVVPSQDYTPNSYFKEEYPIQTDFTCHTSESPQSYSKNDLLNLGNAAHEGGMVDIMTYGVQGRASDQQGKGRMPCKERMGAGLSMSSNTRPEQGKHALERLQHSGETPSALHGKGNLTRAESNQNRSKDTDRINPKSSLPPSTSEFYSVPSASTTLHDTQSCLSHTNPVTFWSLCNSNIIPKERYPPNIDSYGTKPTVSNAPPYYSSPPLVFKPSVTSIKPSTFDPVSVVNVDSGDSGALTKIDDHSGYPGSRVEAYGLQGQKYSVVCHEQITVEKVKGRKSSEPVRNEVISPLAGGKSELQVVPSVTNDLTLEPQDSKPSVTVDKPSTLNDHNDSDLDSPCWKGRQAYQSPFQVSEPLNSQLSKDETVRRNSLNPLAPQFFPGKAKRNVDDHQGEHDGYNSFSFPKTTALAVAVSSREDRLMDPFRAETYLSEVSSITGTQSSNDVLQSGKELGLFNKSNRSSLLNASSSSQPYIVEDYHKADSLLVTDQGAIGFVEGVNDTVHDALGSSLSFRMAESLNSPSSGIDVFSRFDERFQGLSKSKPNIDNELLINAMHDLSMLLLRNCSNIDSFNESECDKVQNIINNLNVCVRNRVGRRAPLPDSGHLSNSFGTLQSADHHKEMLDSFSQSSDAVLERGEHVTQIVDKARKENQGIGENMHPKGLMYRNLWLETASALSLVKSKHKAYL
ncbi:hypothetical protein SLE2022_339900 [Rubroshorea leprosula]